MNVGAAAGVPLLDLQAQYAPLRDALLAAITRVCDSQHFILGPEVEALERELAEQLEVEAAVAVSSGTDALTVAMMALGVGQGDEVVTTTYSFFATAGCISRLGAVPVLVDIDPATGNLDPVAAAAAITSRTRAIIPVHLYGQCADMAPILEAAHQAGVPVIEDACQAIGARYHGRQSGALGTIGCFSFYPTKNLAAFGDAGLVTTNDANLAHEIRLLRNHGAEPKYLHQRIGGNFRLDALQAAVLRVKLPHLARWTAMRRANAVRYGELLKFVEAAGLMSLPIEPAGAFHVFNQYVVEVPERDRVRARLAAQEIGTEIYYPVPLHLQACFADLGYARGDFPHAERAAGRTLALPIYPELSDHQISTVAEALADALTRS